MADLLLELFSEEIPARMQADALAHLQSALQKGLGISESKGFVTPRRLAIIIKNLPALQPDITTELKGPKVDAPEAALNGFLKKNNLTLEQLEKRDGVYFATTHVKGRPTADVLKQSIEEILAKFPWPKSMRWGSRPELWVRPLQSILCIFDGNIVPVEFAGIKAGNITYGHRFLAPQAITVNNANEYEEALKKACVIADREKRKADIQNQINAIANARNLKPKTDAGLLEEVVGLVEYPHILVGKIDDAFMDLPPEVLTMVMRSHQKYFALISSPNGGEAGRGASQAQSEQESPHPNPPPTGEGIGKLSPYFLITSNMKTDDDGKAIIAGNERVLRARFADARFFWDSDRKKPLSEWAQGLESVTYHAKLGSVAQKVERIKKLANVISNEVRDLCKDSSQKLGMAELVTRAATLCKADLVTGMVGEFAELQGIMGRYYAIQQHEPKEIADAIRDHYKPAGATDGVPTAPVSVCVALADKIDTLVSMFAIGEKPTGSKDPFALRRAALGVIRIILENNLRLPLNSLFANAPMRDIAVHKAHEKLVKKTEEDLKNPHKIGKYLSVNETAFEDIPEDAEAKLKTELLAFFHDRLKVQLKDSGIRHDVIDAVMAADDDLVRIVNRAKALQEFLLSKNGNNLLAAYKRAANILAAEEKKDKSTYQPQIIGSDLIENAEKTLAALLEKASSELKNLKHHEKFTDMMNKLAELREPLDLFFEKIMVNTEDKQLRNARLCLLSKLRSTINDIADFSKIEG